MGYHRRRWRRLEQILRRRRWHEASGAPAHRGASLEKRRARRRLCASRPWLGPRRGQQPPPRHLDGVDVAWESVSQALGKRVSALSSSGKGRCRSSGRRLGSVLRAAHPPRRPYSGSCNGSSELNTPGGSEPHSKVTRGCSIRVEQKCMCTKELRTQLPGIPAAPSRTLHRIHCIKTA